MKQGVALRFRCAFGGRKGSRSHQAVILRFMRRTSGRMEQGGAIGLRFHPSPVILREGAGSQAGRGKGVLSGSASIPLLSSCAKAQDLREEGARGGYRALEQFPPRLR